MWDFSIGRTLGLLARTYPFILLRMLVYFGITFAYLVATGAVAGVGAIASYAGYVTTWVICGVTALICAIVLFFVPKLAFADVEPDEAAPSPAGDVPGDSVSAASADGE